jgi:hypothetical protein
VPDKRGWYIIGKERKEVKTMNRIMYLMFALGLVGVLLVLLGPWYDDVDSILKGIGQGRDFIGGSLIP